MLHGFRCSTISEGLHDQIRIRIFDQLNNRCEWAMRWNLFVLFINLKASAMVALCAIIDTKLASVKIRGANWKSQRQIYDIKSWRDVCPEELPFQARHSSRCVIEFSLEATADREISGVGSLAASSWLYDGWCRLRAILSWMVPTSSKFPAC